MANMYSQIYIQIVFTVKRRQNLILKKYRDKIQNTSQELLAKGSKNY